MESTHFLREDLIEVSGRRVGIRADDFRDICSFHFRLDACLDKSTQNLTLNARRRLHQLLENGSLGNVVGEMAM